MTIDTSKEAIAALTQCLQTLGRDMDRHAAPEWDEHENVFLAVNTIDALAAERDAQAARADAAEAREQALLSTYDAERKALVENVALRSEVKRMAAELSAMRAGQDALVAAAYEAAAEWHIARIAEMNAQIAENNEYMARRGLTHSDCNAYCRDSILNSRIAVKAIRALTTSDATAALDARLLAERNKALREAIAGFYAQAANRTLFTAREIEIAILAMIEKDTDQ